MILPKNVIPNLNKCFIFMFLSFYEYPKMVIFFSKFLIDQESFNFFLFFCLQLEFYLFRIVLQSQGIYILAIVISHYDN